MLNLSDFIATKIHGVWNLSADISDLSAKYGPSFFSNEFKVQGTEQTLTFGFIKTLFDGACETIGWEFVSFTKLGKKVVLRIYND